MKLTTQKILIFFVGLFYLLDTFFTTISVELLGIEETNPWLSEILNLSGTEGFIISKMIVLYIFLVVVIIAEHSQPRALIKYTPLFIILLIFYGLVNLFHIYGLTYIFSNRLY